MQQQGDGGSVPRHELQIILSSIMFQAQNAIFSTVGCITETQKEEEDEEEKEVNEDVKLQLSSEVPTTEASLKLRRHSSSYSR